MGQRVSFSAVRKDGAIFAMAGSRSIFDVDLRDKEIVVECYDINFGEVLNVFFKDCEKVGFAKVGNFDKVSKDCDGILVVDMDLDGGSNDKQCFPEWFLEAYPSQEDYFGEFSQIGDVKIYWHLFEHFA